MSFSAPVPGFEGLYVINRAGTVVSIKKGVAITSRLTQKGYPYVRLYKDGKPHMRVVHRLLAKAFIPNPNELPQVNHKDGNKENNDLSNLEWCTNSHNNEHALASGLKPCGVAHHSARLDPEKVRHIRRAVASGESNMVDLAVKYGVSPVAIRKVVIRKSWRHVD